MKAELARVLPAEIEKRSMELITRELGARVLPEDTADIVKRVIHTTADFDYADNLVFSPGAAEAGVEALKAGATIITDTNMAYAGINKPACEQLGVKVVCFMADPEIAEEAKKQACTRAAASMEYAAMNLSGRLIFAVGNAPTALARLYELITDGDLKPNLIIGVPVGFVNVVESKKLILTLDTPHIVARGRKGGSNVAAAICNALLYRATGRTL
jgi:precorrin-8X/cobalt-precorrin-8 methylmutase